MQDSLLMCSLCKFASITCKVMPVNGLASFLKGLTVFHVLRVRCIGEMLTRYPQASNNKKSFNGSVRKAENAGKSLKQHTINIKNKALTWCPIQFSGLQAHPVLSFSKFQEEEIRRRKKDRKAVEKSIHFWCVVFSG